MRMHAQAQAHRDVHARSGWGGHAHSVRTPCTNICQCDPESCNACTRVCTHIPPPPHAPTARPSPAMPPLGSPRRHHGITEFSHPTPPHRLTRAGCQAHTQPGARSPRPREHTHKPHGLTPTLARAAAHARPRSQEEVLPSRCLYPPLTPSPALPRAARRAPTRHPHGTHPNPMPPSRTGMPLSKGLSAAGGGGGGGRALALLLYGLAAGTTVGHWHRRHRAK